MKDRGGCCDDARRGRGAPCSHKVRTLGRGWRADFHHQKGKIRFKSLLRTQFGHSRSEIGNSIADSYITTNMPLGGPRLGPMANINHTHILSANSSKHSLLLSDFFVWLVVGSFCVCPATVCVSLAWSWGSPQSLSWFKADWGYLLCNLPHDVMQGVLAGGQTCLGWSVIRSFHTQRPTTGPHNCLWITVLDCWI